MSPPIFDMVIKGKVCGKPLQDVFVPVQRNNPELLYDILNYLKSIGICWIDCIQKKSGRTPLHACARFGNMDIISILCEKWKPKKRKYLELTDIHGKTCLHEAAQACRPEIVEYIIKRGARIDPLKKGNWTPLMLACTKTGEPAIKTIKVLLRYGANIALKNKDGWSPLHLAVREGDIEIISFLISKKADVNALTKNGRSILHIAALHSKTKAVELLLNQRNVSVDCKDACGMTPFLDASVGGCVEIARLLVTKGANINQVDDMGMSSLHLAAESGHDDMVKYLVECGVNVNVQAALTPLHCAAKAGKTSTAKMLLDLGADVHSLPHGVVRTVVRTARDDEEEEQCRYVYEEILNLFM